MATPPARSSSSRAVRLKRIVVATAKLLLLVTIAIKGAEGLDNGVGQVPPMGWNSWNFYQCGISEEVVLGVARRLVELGLDELGYRYVNMDDCWMAMSRDPTTHKYVLDADRFPNGMAHLSQEIAQRGLKLGIYTSAGTHTCAGRPGSLGFEELDAQTFADWGIDYLKYDNCNNEGQPGVDRYSRMRDALNATGRPMFYSLCQWGTEQSWKWAPAVGNSWRTTMDIRPFWGSVASNFWASQDIFVQSASSTSSVSLAWLDPDMLEVGNGNLTWEENQSHFSLWCLAKSPLLLGNDLFHVTNETLRILSNRHLIALHQDARVPQASCFLGRCSATAADATWSIFVTTAPAEEAEMDRIVLIVNWNDEEALQDATFAGQDVGVVPAPHQVVQVTDLWQDNQPVGVYNYTQLKSVPIPTLKPHESVVYRMSLRGNSTSNEKDNDDDDEEDQPCGSPASEEGTPAQQSW